MFEKLLQRLMFCRILYVISKSNINEEITKLFCNGKQGYKDVIFKLSYICTASTFKQRGRFCKSFSVVCGLVGSV